MGSVPQQYRVLGPSLQLIRYMLQFLCELTVVSKDAENERLTKKKWISVPVSPIFNPALIHACSKKTTWYIRCIHHFVPRHINQNQGGHSIFKNKFQEFSRSFPGVFLIFPGVFMSNLSQVRNQFLSCFYPYSSEFFIQYFDCSFLGMYKHFR